VSQMIKGGNTSQKESLKGGKEKKVGTKSRRNRNYWAQMPVRHSMKRKKSIGKKAGQRKGAKGSEIGCLGNKDEARKKGTTKSFLICDWG